MRTEKRWKKIFSDHKSEMMRQAETRIKAETTNAKRTVSQALAKSQLEIKRSQGKVQQELKDKVFEEAMQLVNDYMKTKAYDDFLVKCIRKAERFAGDDPVVIYINPSDEKKTYGAGKRNRGEAYGECGRFYRRGARGNPFA